MQNQTRRNLFRLWRSLCLIIALSTMLYGFRLYFSGFFPTKTVMAGYATPDETFFDESERPEFYRLVWIVFDGMRLDQVLPDVSENEEYSRVFQNAMTNTRNIIKQQGGLPFKCTVKSPTVTLPRIKSMVSGSIPLFMDYINNLFSGEVTEDNLLYQFNQKNKKIVFYGDDTWTRAFPGYFYRSEPLSSFYVNDFYGVDNNVTANLNKELQNNDWDVMILHYLGLDHIGHVEGPASNRAVDKLREYDHIIAKTFDQILRQDEERCARFNSTHQAHEGEEHCQHTLLLVTADHGTHDQGGHGGDSPGEVLVPVLFLSPHFRTIGGNGTFESLLSTPFHMKQVQALISALDKQKRANKVDLAVTLGHIMHVSVPRCSLGLVLPEVLWLHSRSSSVHHFSSNAAQLMNLLKADPQHFDPNSKTPISDAAKKVLYDYDLANLKRMVLKSLANNHNNNPQERDRFLNGTGDFGSVLGTYVLLCSQISDILSRHSSDFETQSMIIGIIMIGTSAICLACCVIVITFQVYDPIKSNVNLSRGEAEKGMIEKSRGEAKPIVGITIWTILFAIFLSVVCKIESLYHPPHLENWFDGLSWTGLFLVSLMGGTCVYCACFALFKLYLDFGKKKQTGVEVGGFDMPSPRSRPDPESTSLETYWLYMACPLFLASMGSTSFIEFEHYTHYHFTTTLLVLSLYDQLPNMNFRQFGYYLMLLVSFRVMRGWNRGYVDETSPFSINTHNNLINEPSTMLNAQYQHLLFPITFICILCVFVYAVYLLRRGLNLGFVGFNQFVFSVVSILFAGLFTSIYKYQQINTSQGEIFVARLAILGIISSFVSCLYIIFKPTTPKNEINQNASVVAAIIMKLFLVIFIILAILLHRSHNSFLIILMGINTKSLTEITKSKKINRKNTISVIMTIIWLSYSSFYCFGNSNSLNTIDINGGYTGLYSYNQFVVGLFTAVILYTGPIFYTLGFIIILAEISERACDTESKTIKVYSLLNNIEGLVWMAVYISSLCSSVMLMGLCLVSGLLRHHLFVFSVFSPRLIYAGMGCCFELVRVIMMLTCVVLVRIVTSKVFGNVDNKSFTFLPSPLRS